MAGQSRKETDSNKKTQSPSTGRVVDLKAWKARRERNTHATKGRPAVVVARRLGWVFAVLAALSAAVSCVPSTWQLQAIILAWFFAILCGSTALVLVALYRRPKRMFVVMAICMAVSLTSAIIHNVS